MGKMTSSLGDSSMTAKLRRFIEGGTGPLKLDAKSLISSDGLAARTATQKMTIQDLPY